MDIVSIIVPLALSSAARLISELAAHAVVSSVLTNPSWEAEASILWHKSLSS